MRSAGRVAATIAAVLGYWPAGCEASYAREVWRTPHARWRRPTARHTPHRAPRPSAVRLLHTVDAAAPRSASAVTSTRVTHFTHWKPRWPGDDERHGAPWPCVSGSPPTWVASTRSRASARAKLQR